MTNPKIEKINADIERTKKNILKQQARLRGLERQRKIEEDAEIVAFYRREILPDKNLSELVRQKLELPPLKQTGARMCLNGNRLNRSKNNI